jgi:hypothetical protein
MLANFSCSGKTERVGGGGYGMPCYSCNLFRNFSAILRFFLFFVSFSFSLFFFSAKVRTETTSESLIVGLSSSAEQVSLWYLSSYFLVTLYNTLFSYLL